MKLLIGYSVINANEVVLKPLYMVTLALVIFSAYFDFFINS